MKFSGKILLVDDEPHIRKFVGLLLKTLGSPTIVEAANGEDAITIYDKEKPDLVLLDVNMPRLDGLQTLMVLRTRDPDSIVVMLTSLINRKTVEECQRLGAVGYIRKDSPREEMVAQFERIIGECFLEEGQPVPATPPAA